MALETRGGADAAAIGADTACDNRLSSISPLAKSRHGNAPFSLLKSAACGWTGNCIAGAERESMLKIQRTANGYVVFAVSGRLEADSLRELSDLLSLESSARAVTLELTDLVLVDRDAVGFLRECAQKGIELRNCPRYIQTWMASDGEGA
jgi:hypothetical protein